MGSGADSALAKGTNRPSAATADIQPSVNTSLQPDEMSGSVSPDPCPQSRVASNNHTSLADMMSPFFNGQPGGWRPCIGPDMFPMLQSVCGQVTQLSIENAAKTAGAYLLQRAGAGYGVADGDGEEADGTHGPVAGRPAAAPGEGLTTGPAPGPSPQPPQDHSTHT